MAIMIAIMGTGSISQCWYTPAWWYWLYYRIASQKYIKRIKKFALKSGIKASNKRPLSVAMLQCPLARLRAECVCVCVNERERAVWLLCLEIARTRALCARIKRRCVGWFLRACFWVWFFFLLCVRWIQCAEKLAQKKDIALQIRS